MSADETALDNPVWSCLATRHARFAQGGALARRYRVEFSPLSAMAAAAPDNVDALLGLVGVGEEISIAGPHVPAESPPGFETAFRIGVVQMIRRDGTPLAEEVAAVSPLSATDVGDMLALVELKHPGPFRLRTIEPGSFLGVRQDGELVAMAGERMWIDRYRELSAVCTRPAAEGRGYARALVSRVVNRMLSAGETPILHVESTNRRAIDLYLGLGFVRRAEFPLLHVKRVG